MSDPIDNRIGPNFGKPLSQRPVSVEIARLTAERDALAGQVAALRESLTLADEVARLTTWGIIVSDCREACEHPACLILRAIATYRKARAALAAAGGEGAA